MSYIRSTLKCDACGFEMNVAFGIVGMTQIAGHPNRCPECDAGYEHLTKIADGWRANGAADPLSPTAPLRAAQSLNAVRQYDPQS